MRGLVLSPTSRSGMIPISWSRVAIRKWIPAFTRSPRNQRAEQAYGCELEGRYVFSDWFSSFGSYAWSRRRDRAGGGERNQQAPEHKVNLGATFTGERVEERIRSRVVGLATGSENRAFRYKADEL